MSVQIPTILLAVVSLLTAGAVCSGCGQRGPLVMPARAVPAQVQRPADEAGEQALQDRDPACSTHDAAGRVVVDAVTSDTRVCPPLSGPFAPPMRTLDASEATLPNAINPYLLPSQPGLDPALR